MQSIEVDPERGYWLWTGRLHPTGGYVQFHLNGKRHYGHRASWILHRGPIPEGMLVCHRCDVRHCLNPAHLFLGTAQDNTDDMLAKRRGYWPGPPPRPGEASGSAKLTERSVVWARREWKAGRLFPDIARDLGVCTATAHMAITGQTWGHVTEEPPTGPIKGRGVAPKRKRRSFHAKGEGNPKAKLTAATAAAIRESDAKGTDLARKYGVSSTQIYNIRKGKSWA